MIFEDRKLKTWANNGGIKPYDTACINPASIDLKLGNRIRVSNWYWRNPVTRYIAWKLRNKVSGIKMWSEQFEFSTYTLWPGEFVLCHSTEITHIPPDVVALLFEKSTTGRMGLEHSHSTFGDPGFSGQWTLELFNVAPWPIELIAGMKLVQIALISTFSTPEKLYGEVGRYQYQMGAVAPRKEKKHD